jgi:hypothetical protein
MAADRPVAANTTYKSSGSLPSSNVSMYGFALASSILIGVFVIDFTDESLMTFSSILILFAATYGIMFNLLGFSLAPKLSSISWVRDAFSHTPHEDDDFSEDVDVQDLAKEKPTSVERKHEIIEESIDEITKKLVAKFS